MPTRHGRGSSPVERAVLAAAVAVQALLDAASAAVQGIAGEADDVEGIHHAGRVGQLFGGGRLEPGEPVHRDHLHPGSPGVVPVGYARS